MQYTNNISYQMVAIIIIMSLSVCPEDSLLSMGDYRSYYARINLMCGTS
jgi:hypothetical protein